MADDHTRQIIKRSIAYRARFRVESKKVVAPFQIVPHPQNRGGDPVKSLRTQQIIHDIMKDGYDPIDANSNGVLVEEKPVVAGGSERVLQEDFEKKIKVDPDMAQLCKLSHPARYGSLSHSHLNCSFRNILGNKKGCECSGTRGGGAERAKCDCKYSPLLDDQGNYDLERVRAHDGEWGRQCEGGLEWEVLSWRLDEEEPEAALAISIALNKKNETAMKTGHLEIMSTLVGLCKPDPQGCVPFEPVRDKLIDLYGTEIDHPDFLHLFKVVCDAGGESSIHMKDLFSFTGVFVNPKIRKMRMEAYGVIAPYPVEFPKIKNACLKWAWKQPPTRGFCQIPPSIAHRFNQDSKFQMYDFLKEVEGAFLQLGKMASTVVEGPTSEKLRCKWIAEVEVTVMAKIRRAALSTAGPPPPCSAASSFPYPPSQLYSSPLRSFPPPLLKSGSVPHLPHLPSSFVLPALACCPPPPFPSQAVPDPSAPRVGLSDFRGSKESLRRQVCEGAAGRYLKGLQLIHRDQGKGVDVIGKGWFDKGGDAKVFAGHEPDAGSRGIVGRPDIRGGFAVPRAEGQELRGHGESDAQGNQAGRRREGFEHARDSVCRSSDRGQSPDHSMARLGAQCLRLGRRADCEAGIGVSHGREPRPHDMRNPYRDDQERQCDQGRGHDRHSRWALEGAIVVQEGRVHGHGGGGRDHPPESRVGRGVVGQTHHPRGNRSWRRKRGRCGREGSRAA